MTASVSLFPQGFRLEPVTPTSFTYSWHWMLRDTDPESPIRIFLTDEQADELAQMLWNRKLTEKEAA